MKRTLPLGSLTAAGLMTGYIPSIAPDATRTSGSGGSRYPLPEASRRDASVARRVTLGVSILIMLNMVTARSARAQEDEALPRFGQGGQWVATLQTFGEGGGLAFVHKASGGDYEIAVHPAIDYFVTSHLSVGAAVGFVYDSVQTGTTLVNIGARVGYNVGLGESVGLWPTAGVFFYHLTGNGMPTQANTNLEVFAPFLYHPIRHFFTGLGPSLAFEINGPHDHSYGVDFVLGGWI
jgi:hypothetical protein